jgi:hypothetical protein
VTNENTAEDKYDNDLYHVRRMQWMIGIAAGVVAAFLERAVLVRLGLEQHVGPLWLFYPSTVSLCACVLWEHDRNERLVAEESSSEYVRLTIVRFNELQLLSAAFDS